MFILWGPGRSELGARKLGSRGSGTAEVTQNRRGILHSPSFIYTPKAQGPVLMPYMQTPNHQPQASNPKPSLLKDPRFKERQPDTANSKNNKPYTKLQDYNSQQKRGRTLRPLCSRGMPGGRSLRSPELWHLISGSKYRSLGSRV